jgi:hypothetical protein
MLSDLQAVSQAERHAPAMNWKPHPLEPVERERDQLRTEILRLKHDLAGKEQFVDRLQFLLRRRTETIDDLNGKLRQARAANEKLDAECEHYAEMVRRS